MNNNSRTLGNNNIKIDDFVTFIYTYLPKIKDIDNYDNSFSNLQWKDDFFSIKNLDNILNWYKLKKSRFFTFI
jgi:hypothetical protein